MTIVAWIETSSADTGSSATTNSGESASARAIPIRWRCPPENACGYLRAAPGGSPTSSSNSGHLGAALGTADAVRAERLGDEIVDAHARVERRERILEDHLGPLAEAEQPVASQRPDVDAVEEDPPLDRLVQP